MQVTRTYTAKVYPAKRGHQALDEALAAQCRLYNAALEHRRWAYKMGQVSITYAQQSRELTQIRADDPEMEGLHRTIQVGTLRRVDRAFQAFFRRVQQGQAPGFPRFKSSRRWRTLVCDNNVQARSMVKLGDNGRGWIRIKGLPRFEFRSNRELPPIANLAELRIIRKPRRVEAQFVFHIDVDAPEPPAGPNAPIGLDLGVHNQVTMSDGTFEPGYRRDRRRAKRLQRRVSRAVKGSNNRRKKVASLAREHDRLAARRRGWTHELSASIVGKRGYDFIAAENLSIQQMMSERSEELPREVEARVNQGIGDQAWADLLSKIQYKAESAGIGFVQVDPKNTTAACSGCGVLVPKSIGALVHDCPQCGLRLDRRANSARNVLRLGLAQAAGGKLPGAEAARL